MHAYDGECMSVYEEVIELTKKLISIQSPSQKEHQVANFIADWLKKKGFAVKMVEVPNCGPDVIATHEYSKEGRSLMLEGHTDVADIRPGWTKDPFNAVIKDGLLFGRGAFDMKGGLAVNMIVFDRLSKMDLKGKLVFAAVSEEERYSRGSYALCKSGLLKGIDAGLCPDFEGNMQETIIGACSRVVYEIDVTGKGSHFLIPETVVNALDEAAKIIVSLHRMPIKGTLTTLSVEGGDVDTDIVPDKCKIWINRNLSIDEAVDRSLQEFKKFLKTINLKADGTVKLAERPTPWQEPYVLDADKTPIIQCLTQVCREHGINLKTKVLGTADENYFITMSNIDYIIFGPKGGNSHVADEYVEIESLKKLTDIYLKTSKRFLT
jgi:acetylornithine deacetylase/succinyl-diaminopimelate desuccinylase-like protein